MSDELREIRRLLEDPVFRLQTDYQQILKYDELAIEREKGFYNYNLPVFIFYF